MKNAELAEIRAILKANLSMERRPAKPLLRAFKSLLAAPPQPAPARPPLPTPRRVGLSATEPPADAEMPELVLVDPDQAVIDPETDARERRASFGQRQEPTAKPAAPEPPPAARSEIIDEADVGEALRRLGSVLARNGAATLAETPYLPGDLSDVTEMDVERVYAAAGVFAPTAPSSPSATADTSERELLIHLERVFLAERAAVEARLAP
jgi:hypothetical protein